MGNFCLNCGNQLNDGAKFCNKCGNKIVSFSSENKENNNINSNDNNIVNHSFTKAPTPISNPFQNKNTDDSVISKNPFESQPIETKIKKTEIIEQYRSQYKTMFLDASVLFGIGFSLLPVIICGFMGISSGETNFLLIIQMCIIMGLIGFIGGIIAGIIFSILMIIGNEISYSLGFLKTPPNAPAYKYENGIVIHYWQKFFNNNKP